MNRLVLHAQLLERTALRYTPAGLPALDLRLTHESMVTQEGMPRRVSLEIRARAVGQITQQIAGLDIGSTCGFAGFLGSMRNGRGIVFHVTEVSALVGQPPSGMVE
jgi:primosomal replication protein N